MRHASALFQPELLAVVVKSIVVVLVSRISATHVVVMIGISGLLTLLLLLLQVHL